MKSAEKTQNKEREKQVNLVKDQRERIEVIKEVLGLFLNSILANQEQESQLKNNSKHQINNSCAGSNPTEQCFNER